MSEITRSASRAGAPRGEVLAAQAPGQHRVPRERRHAPRAAAMWSRYQCALRFGVRTWVS